MIKEETNHSEIEEQSTIIEEKATRDNGETIVKKYIKGKFLGKGGFAQCYEFTCCSTNKHYAAKIINKSSLVKPKAKEKLLSEIQIHKSLHHTQIVLFHHFFEDSSNVYILLEHCKNQTLADLLQKRKHLTEIEVQCYMIQLVSGLNYLKSRRVIHRDLKLGNLFLTDEMELKIGDFGLATRLEFDEERKRTMCGTPNYIAPEVLDTKVGHSYEVDVWSLGIIMYTLIIGRPPFETKDVKGTYDRIKTNDYSFAETAIISELAKKLISKILTQDPMKRPSLEKILEHDFFKQSKSIPKLLPPSTMTCNPSLSYIRQFIPDVGTSEIAINPFLPNLNDNKVLNPINSINNHKIFAIKVTSQKDGGKLLSDNKPIMIDLKDDLKRFSLHNDSNTSDSVSIMPTIDIWITKWVDYTSKYGFGFLLNNGQCGILFNDNTKIVLERKGIRFNYIERRLSDHKEIIIDHRLDNPPLELHKKVTLLKYFKGFLKGNTQIGKNIVESMISDDEEKIDLIYIKKITKIKHAIMFRLSNKIVQVCFNDQSQILLYSESKLMTYVNNHGVRTSHLLALALESNDTALKNRLKYARTLLTFILTSPHQQQQHIEYLQKDPLINDSLSS